MARDTRVGPDGGATQLAPALSLEKRASRIGKRAVLYVLMFVVAFAMLIPLIWMLSTSLKTPGQIYEYPPVWIPNPVRFENFPEAFAAAPLGRYLLNSFKVTSIRVAGTLLLSSLAAFAFARLRFPGRQRIFGILLATLMVPYIVRVIPLYAMFRSIGWVNRHIALIVPPMFSNIFGVFLLRQFFLTLPMELDEAARIDGATSFQIYSRLILPLSTPALATLALFEFRNSWNQFLPALIFISSEQKQLITVGLTLFRGEYQADWHLMMAGAVLAVLPMLVIFVAAQKYFIRGVALSGIKG